ncbi:MAG: hypothetical protein TR69_WS6001000367 [candidate division WS6 bacterium OLB20]|uniref:Uncharacterized protein n=1 Tax=candidate division WS6 bacterium OLB20 TaxID=1617426 RepID=A0A136M0Q6_9BACT|nr:MAG: hypothetical protein TR69_WS6001000367 [candidate division WS6 bacterium OLB20]
MSTATNPAGLPPLPGTDTNAAPAPSITPAGSAPGLPVIKDEELLDFDRPAVSKSGDRGFRMFVAGIVLINVIIVAVIGFMVLNSQSGSQPAVTPTPSPASFPDSSEIPTATPTASVIPTEPFTPIALSEEFYTSPYASNGLVASFKYPAGFSEVARDTTDEVYQVRYETTGAADTELDRLVYVFQRQNPEQLLTECGEIPQAAEGTFSYTDSNSGSLIDLPYVACDSTGNSGALTIITVLSADQTLTGVVNGDTADLTAATSEMAQIVASLRFTPQ